jgi:PRC-barrel domain
MANAMSDDKTRAFCKKNGALRMVRRSSLSMRALLSAAALLPALAFIVAALALLLANVAQAEHSARPIASFVLAETSAQPSAAGVNEVEKKEKEGTPATVVDGKQLESVLGISAVSSAGEDMGRIVDVVVDRSGQVRAAIIDFGGFLGVGSRKIAVDWGTIHFLPKGKADTVEVDLTKDQLRLAPVYKQGEPVVVIGHSEEKP